MLADALRQTYSLSELLEALGLARSSYFYHRARMQVAEKYTEVRRAMADKRAFVALSKIDDAEATTDLWIRLICLEEALMLILEHGQFDDISAKVRARSDVDKALSMAFGCSQAAERLSVISALTSYTDDLYRNTGQRWLALDVKAPDLAPASRSTPA